MANRLSPSRAMCFRPSRMKAGWRRSFARCSTLGRRSTILAMVTWLGFLAKLPQKLDGIGLFDEGTTKRLIRRELRVPSGRQSHVATTVRALDVIGTVDMRRYALFSLMLGLVLAAA